MLRSCPRTNHFILEAFDRNFWCAVLQSRFYVPDLDSLRSALGKAADNDPELDDCYHLGKKRLAAIKGQFDAFLARLCPIHAAWASASSMRFQIWLGISMLSRCGRDMKEI